MTCIKTTYSGRYEDLVITSHRLEKHLSELLENAPRIDRVAARAKSIDRFLKKAEKVDEFGAKKYDDPLNEIQDQIGARITVFYLSDVEYVKKIILDYLTPIELQTKEPNNSNEFGYFGEHFILYVPDDITPDDNDEFPQFFELQIKTLFQHAWSEAHHDIGYKAPRPLCALEKRQMAFSAAQAWGADQNFGELSRKLCKEVASKLPSND